MTNRCIYWPLSFIIALRNFSKETSCDIYGRLWTNNSHMTWMGVLTLTFSYFAKMMYPFIGEKQSTSDFIVYLTNQIMENPITEHAKKMESDDNYNPLSNYGKSMLGKIYNGKRKMVDASRTILSHLDKDKFSQYLSNFSNDVIDLIGKALLNNEVTIVDDDIIDTCTNLFVSVLEEECAHESDTANNELSSFFKGSTKLQNNPLHKEIVKTFREIAECRRIADFINKEPTMVKFKIQLTDDDLLSLATRFVEDIQDELIIPFDTYKSEMIYIKISQFTTLVAKYKEYLIRELPHYGFPHISRERLGNKNPLLNALPPNPKSKFEIETEHYQAKLKSLYNEIYNSDID